jgi:hypothetical protein
MARRVGRCLRVGLAATLIMADLGAAHAVNLCTLTGQLMNINGTPAADTRVYFKSLQLQNVAGTIIPFSAFSVFTDVNGNLPSNPPVTIPQGAYVLATVGSGQPVQLQIPLATSADLSTLLLANTDPPSLLSALEIGSGGDFGMTVTNPGIGAIGTATLQAGHVIALQGVPVSATLPDPGQFLIQNAAATQWVPASLSGDISPSVSTPGRLSVTSLSGVSSPISIVGSGNSNGSDVVANVDVNGAFDVAAYGASGSLATTTGAVAAGGTSLTVASASGWSPGMYVNISGGGAAPSLGANGTAPTVSCGGASCAGSDTFSYQCVAGDVFGGYTASSPTGSVVVGVATLTATTYATVTCATVTGAIWYAVYRTAVPSGSSQTVGLIGFYSQPNGSASKWVDDGTLAVATPQVDDLPLASPVVAHADRLISKVTAINGATLTISPAAISAVTNGTIRHDDTTPIQNALDACNSAGGGVVRLANSGISPVTNSGSPYLSSASFKNLALLFYSNCAIEGSGWSSGIKAESVQDTLYPKNGVQYNGVGSVQTINVTMRDFQVDGNNDAVPFADGYVGSGGAETVQVGIYLDDVQGGAYSDIYVHNTGTDCNYIVNGSSNWSYSNSRASSCGRGYDVNGQYRGYVMGCGASTWKLIGDTADGSSGEGIDINTECGGVDDAGWVVAANDIRNNQSYAFQIGDAGEAVGGTGTRKGLVEGNNIHDNAGAFLLVAGALGNPADLGSIKITGNTISDDINSGSNTDVYFNCVSGGTCEDIDFSDNDFVNSAIPSGNQSAIEITNSSVSRTLIDGNRFKNWNLGSTVPISDAGTNTVVGCNYFGSNYAFECGSWGQGQGHAASGNALQVSEPTLVSGNLNFNGANGIGLADATTNDEAVNYGQLLRITPLSGTTTSIGGSALAAGACTSGSVSVPGATTSMAAVASPVSDPQVDSTHAVNWSAWVSAAATVTVRVCAGAVGTTPNAVAYNVRVME